MSDQTSIWKKELKLRKRSPKPAPESTGPELHGGKSIWKKEIRLKRSNPKSGPSESAVDLVEEAVEAVESDAPAFDGVSEGDRLVLDDPAPPPAFWGHGSKEAAESFEAQPETLDPATSPPFADGIDGADGDEVLAPATFTGVEEQYSDLLSRVAEDAEIGEPATDDASGSSGYGSALDEHEPAVEPVSALEGLPAWPANWVYEAAESAAEVTDSPIEREDAEPEDAAPEDAAATAPWPVVDDDRSEPDSSIPTWHYETFFSILGEEATPGEQEDVPRYELPVEPDDATSEASSDWAWTETAADIEQPEIGHDDAWQESTAAAATWPAPAEAHPEPDFFVPADGDPEADAVEEPGEAPDLFLPADGDPEADAVEEPGEAPDFAVPDAADELDPAPAETTLARDVDRDTAEALGLETAAEPAAPVDEAPAAAMPAASAEPKSGSSKKKKKKQKSKSSNQTVGVRIGSSHIMVSVVRNSHGAAEASQLASAPVDRGVIVAGEVREPDALAAQLEAVFAKHKLPRKGIRLGIASNRVGVRTLEVPAIEDPKALDNAIRFRAQDVLSIPLGDVILDHVVLGETETDEGRMLRVLLVFAHREIVDRYVEAFKKAKLKLASIDFEAFALLRAVCPPNSGEAPDRATVALSIGQERTIFAVAEGRQCDFTRVLEWGGGSLTVALARALDMTPSQAEPVKRALAFSGDPEHAELSADQLESARAAARTELQVLARELLASLHFYQSRPGSLAIGEILVTGGGLELKGAAEELQSLLGVPVRTVDPYENVRPARKAKISNEPGATAIAIGLGMDA